MALLFKRKTDEEIKKEIEKKKELVLRRADILRPFLNKEGTGWSVYASLIKEYAEACKKRKAITALDRLIPGNPQDEKTLMEDLIQ